MSRFQLIFTGILVALGVAGAIVFAVAKNNASQGAIPVVMWGTLDSQTVSNFLSQAMVDNRDTLSVSYIQKSSASFEADLISALAKGAGPDMVLLPQDLILKQLDKFYVIPYATYSERAFKNSFIEEGELYLTSEGVVGLPLSVDPLVMYWNRDMFTDAGIPLPPTSWSQFFDLATKLTSKDKNGNIVQSAIAFGEARNVTHFKDLFALLALQAGTPIVGVDQSGFMSSKLAARGATLVPAEEALSYFTEFSNPLKTSYSWNRALPNDRAAFIGGKLAVYFGFASELRSIRAANPNLNFDVASIPQAQGKKETFGFMTAIAILKSSTKIAPAYIAATILTSDDLSAQWSALSGLPPAKRSLLASLPGDAYNSIFYKSALIANAWLDPNREATTDVFGSMIENVTSGRLRVSEAVTQASQQIDALLKANK